MPARQSSQPQVRRPLVGLACAAAAGLTAGARWYVAPPLLLLLAALALLSMLLWHCAARRLVVASYLATASLLVAVALLFWVNLLLHTTPVSPRDLSLLMDRPREGLEVAGVVVSDPAVRGQHAAGGQTVEFQLRLRQIRRQPEWQKARGLVVVRLNLPAAARRPAYAEHWWLAGAMTDNARWAGAASPAAAGPARYWLRVECDDALRLKTGPRWHVMAWLLRARQFAARRLESGILAYRPQAVGMLKALLLGYRQQLDPGLRELFAATGTYHIFAISGQHVAILAMFAVVLLQAGGLRRHLWLWFLAPLLLAFTLATGMSASAMRGCIMAMVVFAGFALHRKPDAGSALAAAALIISAIDPLQFFQVGFRLSFTVVAGLIILCPPLWERAQTWLQPDPWRSAPESAGWRVFRRFLRGIMLLLISSLAAWLASAPLMALWFKRVVPVALVANLAAVPACSLLLLAGCLSILTGTVWPWLGEVFNFAATVVADLLVNSLSLLVRLPGAEWRVAAPSGLTVTAWYAGLLAWLPGWVSWKKRLAVTFLLLGSVLTAAIWQSRHFEVEIYNMGEAPVCLLRVPGGNRLLLQTGPRRSVWLLARRLEESAITRLAAVLLPRTDAGRAGGLADLLQVINVSQVWLMPEKRATQSIQRALGAAPEVSVCQFGDRPLPAALDLLWDQASGAFSIRHNKGMLCLERSGEEPACTSADVVRLCDYESGRPRSVLAVYCVQQDAGWPASVRDAENVLGLTAGQGVRLRLSGRGQWKILSNLPD